MRGCAALLAVLLFLSSGAAQATGWHSRFLLQEQPQTETYKNLLSAAQSEVQIIQQLYNGVFRDQGWANTEDFRQLLKLALNTTANLTAFFPSDDSWQRVADYYCLTQQGVLDNISNLRDMLANYIKAHLVPNVTLHSKDFRDGMVLYSMARPATNPLGPPVNHTLSKVVTNGKVTWIFRNASIYKIPGTFDYEDIKVNPRRMDISAGAAVIHVMDTLFRNMDTERFWEGLRQQVLERAGMPPDSLVCPGNVTGRQQQGIAPSQIAGLVIGVVIGLLLLAGVLMLILVMRAHDSGGFLHGPLKTLSATLQRRRRSASGGGDSGGGCGSISPSGGGDGDGGSPASGSGDAFGSPLLRPPGLPRSGPLPHLSNASSALLTTRGSSSSLTGSMHVLAADGLAADQAFMAVVNEERSPGSHRGVGHGTPSGSAAGLHVVRQGSSLAGDTASSSTTTGAIHRTTDSFGSGQTPFLSRGSGHGSKKDLLALAAAGAAAGGLAAHHAGANGNGNDAPPGPFDSLELLGGALAAGGSLEAGSAAAVGRINHEHVIPITELTLKELIGSGAEGKVYRGTWKHTDIAAKEYLPIEPAAQEHSNNNKGDSPSDAAMAHARAALAKEVHWLTSLNHPNLVRFCAVCLERPLVVMEFYKHGSVFAMLQKAARELARSRQARRRGYVAHFNWDRRLEMLHDVAAGMSYLHGKDHVHGDLRSPNLFVGADGKVKIGDFGFTKRLTPNTASLKVKRITHPRWVAPELMMDNTLSQSSDVYSFAIIMFELLTFRIPFDNLGKEQVVINVVQGFRPEVPEECDLPPGTSSSTCLFTYVRLMRECWSHDPAARPSFEVIARRLKAMQRWRTIISKHSALHRAANMLRQSSSCSSLHKQGSTLNGCSAQNGGGGSPLLGSAAVAAAAAAADGASAAGYRPGTPSASAAAPNGTAGGSSSVATSVLMMPRPHSALLPAPEHSAPPPPPPVPLRGVAAVTGASPQQPQQQLLRGPSTASPSTSFQQLQQQQHSQHAVVPEYSSSECDEDSLPEFEEFEDVDGAALQPGGSAPVSEAVVAGTRLAVIGVSSHQDERDALASVAGTAAELSLLARKVVLVGSDLPAGAFSRRSGLVEEGSAGSSRHSRPRPSSSASFTMMGLKSEPAARLHSVVVPDKRQLQQTPSASATATVAAAAAALATAAAKSSSTTGGPQQLPPNGTITDSRQQQQLPPNGKTPAAAAAGVPAVRTAVRAAAAGAGVASADGQQQQQQAPVRRHSDPLPPKSRLSADGTAAEDGSPAADDSATGLSSSGQSPFAFVHVPSELACTPAELQQQHLQEQQQQQHGAEVLDMRLIQSYPLSTTASEVGSPLPSAASTPEQLTAWQQHRRQNGKHQQQLVQQQHQKLQQLQQRQLGKQQQQLRSPPLPLQKQQQKQQQQLEALQQRRQSSQGPLHPSQSLPPPQQQEQPPTQDLTQQQAPPASRLVQHSSLTAAAVAAVAAAGPVGPEGFERPAAAAAEVYTPYDSPFYQDLTWAPCASVSGMDSNAGSFSVRNAAAAGVSLAMQSDSSSMCSPFQQQQLAQQQQQAQQHGSFTGSAGAAAVMTESISGPWGGSLSQTESSAAVHTQQQPQQQQTSAATSPVLKQALTIEYLAGLTPMAAAAAEAVSLHSGSRRSLCLAGAGAGQQGSSSLTGSRRHSFAAVQARSGNSGSSTTGSALAAPSAAGSRSGSATAASGGNNNTTSGGGGGSGQLDVAAPADTGVAAALPAATAAASVVVESLSSGSKAAAAVRAASTPGAKSSGRSTPVAAAAAAASSDQQQQPQLKSWGSHMDVMPPAAAAGGAAAAAAGGPGCEPEAVQRPSWWRMLSTRRSSVPGA